ncbi:coproporphyrinogen III oxidase [Azospirillum sp. RWY-5-1]|uniref:Heme chaperone HemW n=1 Tax=Azospirillum oleiclasticum TaxID=2735135 RepID=A0ABX2TN66_9PROT|nr:radical SAM family heme chaperone HemW [Azospirillum oleiclasticum]NYZ17333.1 coproporphyrinogen III oxidase [Azospirillum oleiclasticum]NYZ24725.1 coproporphyrinogen III oxidase [Azospirillum oleiclasticum]
MLPVDHDPGFGIYVHWPFCKAKCPYCDFNSHVRDRIDQERWRAGLLRELDHYADATAGRTVTSIFFGGGTPSLMEPATVAALVDRVAARWPVADRLEVTLEANPTSVEAGRFRGFREAGVNRVSLGIQALDDASLRFLGRQHSAAEALEAIGLARSIFDRFSFDLIYARPGQTVPDWERELRRALDFAVGHLSVYQLTIEEGTAFFPLHARGALVLPDEETAGDLYEATQAVLDAAGLPAYEISNHARPGEESRHNLTYWRYGDYVGVGPGAHGRLTLDGTKLATRAHRAPEIWLERVERDGHGAHAPETVGLEERASEMLMMGLRLAEGVPLARLRAETGRDLHDLAAPGALERLAAGGFIEVTAERLRATEAGRQRLNAVLAALLA